MVDAKTIDDPDAPKSHSMDNTRNGKSTTPAAVKKVKRSRGHSALLNLDAGKVIDHFGKYGRYQVG
jgi:hypothetical protein